MTGHTRGGNSTHQREKILAILRLFGDLDVYVIYQKCHNTDDVVVNQIKARTINRILHELSNLNMVRKLGGKWHAFPMVVKV